MLSDGLESVCSSQQHQLVVVALAVDPEPPAVLLAAAVDNLPFELVDNEVDD